MNDILFRCNVSPETGTGHIRRCMVLAQEIIKLGGQVYFLLKLKDVNLGNLLCPIVERWEVLDWDISSADELKTLVQLYTDRKMSALVVDHYDADPEYQQQLFDAGVTWLQFDGCNGKMLWADWVLNPSLAYKTCMYDRLLKRDETKLLLGPKYAFLRSEFRDYRHKIQFREIPEKILISMGGGDDRGAILYCLNALVKMETLCEFIVLTSSYNPRNESIFNWVAERSQRIKIIVDEPEIAKRMVEADIGIIAGGMTTFETAAMGLPSIIIQIAGNQARNAAAWDKAGVAIDMGNLDQLNAESLCNKLMELKNNPGRRKKMQTIGMDLVDGLAGARVAKLMLNSKNNCRKEL